MGGAISSTPRWRVGGGGAGIFLPSFDASDGSLLRSIELLNVALWTNLSLVGAMVCHFEILHFNAQTCFFLTLLARAETPDRFTYTDGVFHDQTLARAETPSFRLTFCRFLPGLRFWFQCTRSERQCQQPACYFWSATYEGVAVRLNDCDANVC